MLTLFGIFNLALSIFITFELRDNYNYHLKIRKNYCLIWYFKFRFSIFITREPNDNLNYHLKIIKNKKINFWKKRKLFPMGISKATVSYLGQAFTIYRKPQLILNKSSFWMFILRYWKWKSEFDNWSIYVQFGVTFIMVIDLIFNFFLPLI